MRKITDAQTIFEGYNKCSGSINELKYTQMDVLFKINGIPYRTLLPDFMVKKGFIEKKFNRYSSLKEKHVPVEVPLKIFEEFVAHVRNYNSSHKSCSEKKGTNPLKAMGIKLPDIIKSQGKVELPESKPGDEKFKLVKEVFGNSQISDESKKTLLEVLNVKL